MKVTKNLPALLIHSCAHYCGREVSKRFREQSCLVTWRRTRCHCGQLAEHPAQAQVYTTGLPRCGCHILDPGSRMPSCEGSNNPAEGGGRFESSAFLCRPVAKVPTTALAKTCERCFRINCHTGPIPSYAQPPTFLPNSVSQQWLDTRVSEADPDLWGNTTGVGQFWGCSPIWAGHELNLGS